MQWVRNNRFLAGFIGVMVVAVGLMGYLVYSSYSHYAQVDEEYTTQLNELKRLQAIKPYPQESNLETYNQKKAAFGQAVTEFQTKLASMEPASDKPLSPSDFQNRLREVVRDIGSLAHQKGVDLKEGFYMGFEQYRESLPDTAATPLLTTQLAAIDELVRILITRKVDRIDSIKRAPLEQEGSAAASATPTPPPNPAMAKNAGPELITRQPIEIIFSAPPSAFRDSLNEIVKAPRFFVIRALQVKNQVDKGPARGAGVDTASPTSTAAPTTPNPDNPTGGNGQPLPEKGPPPLRYIAGQEKLDVLAYIELTKIAPPR